jgi:hypothetical protein
MTPCPPNASSKNEGLGAPKTNLEPIVHFYIREKIWIIKTKELPNLSRVSAIPRTMEKRLFNKTTTSANIRGGDIPMVE